MKRPGGVRNISGFTLIEMLVVVAIIGILATILAANFNEARQNSRDKVRMSELKELQLALEMYKAQNGRYPAPGCGAPVSLWVGPGPLPAWGQGYCDDYISGLVPDYISELPRDPNQENDNGEGFIYRTDASGGMYKVLVHQSVEALFITAQTDEFARLPEVCGVSAGNILPQQYAIYSPGFECM
jgi:type II secretion system protein G